MLNYIAAFVLFIAAIAVASSSVDVAEPWHTVLCAITAALIVASVVVPAILDDD